MKRWLLCLMLCSLVMVIPSLAQDATPTPGPDMTPTALPPFVGTATIDVESVFVRVSPDQDSEAVASLFENDTVQVIGRNLDGLWFEVQRPNRMFSLGWVSADLLDYEFLPEALPLTDAETGLVGEVPIPEENIPVYLAAESNLRAGDVTTADILAVVPLGAVLPAIGRNQDTTWLFVNYRGIEGWVSSAVFRRRTGLDDLPDATLKDGDVALVAAEIIPPEIQLGQLERFRQFVVSSRDVTAQLAPFWFQVSEGEVMPCNPPGFVNDYLITRDDVRQLPELNRYVPRFNEGVILLNESIEPLYLCGVLLPNVVAEARNDAINANIIFAATNDALDSLETLIREDNDLEVEPTASP